MMSNTDCYTAETKLTALDGAIQERATRIGIDLKQLRPSGGDMEIIPHQDSNWSKVILCN